MPEVANIAEKLAPEELKKVEKPEVKPEVLAIQIKEKLEKIRDPELMKEIRLIREAINPQDPKLGETLDATVAGNIELLSKQLKKEIPDLERMKEEDVIKSISAAIKIEF